MKPASPYLISRRKAAHTLNQLCKNLGFGAKAEHFDPDNQEQWSNHGENLVIAMRNDVIIAEVEILDGTQRHITIPRWDGLIRTAHLSEFDPAHHGLVTTISEDVLFNEKFPDSVGIVDFGEAPGLELPAQPIQKATRVMQPKVVM
jgi:hypothetical protein